MVSRQTYIFVAIAVIGLLLAVTVWYLYDIGTFEEKGDIVIGALMPVTGPASYTGYLFPTGSSIAIDEINDAGGVLGRKLVAIYEDSQCDPIPGVMAARKLIDVNNVKAIYGTFCSTVTLPVMNLTGDAGIFLFTEAGAEDISYIDKDGLVFRTSRIIPLLAPSIAKVMYDDGVTRVGVIAVNDAWGTCECKFYGKTFEALGVEYKNVLVARDAATYRSEIDSLFEWGPDAIAIPAYTPVSMIIMREAYEAGYTTEHGWYAADVVFTEGLIDELGPAAEGITVIGSHVSASPAYTNLVSKFEASAGKKPDQFQLQIYDMVNVMALAMEAAGTDDPLVWKDEVASICNPPGEKVYSFAEGLEKLRAGAEIDFDGAMGPMTFNQYGDTWIELMIQKVTDGELVELFIYTVDEQREDREQILGPGY